MIWQVKRGRAQTGIERQFQYGVRAVRHCGLRLRSAASAWGVAAVLLAFGLASASGASGDSPNLAPYTPSGWANAIVVSKTTETHTDDQIRQSDAVFVDWAVGNNGRAATTQTFYTTLYVDNVLKATWQTDPPLEAGNWAGIEDYFIGTFSAGVHTVKIEVDSTAAITETNELDNTYTKTFVVVTSKPDIRIAPEALTFSEVSASASNGATASVSSTSAGLEDWRIRLASGTVVPNVSGQDGATSLSPDPQDPGARHMLIQFQRILTETDLEALRQKGLIVLRYVPNRAYWVTASAQARVSLVTSREGGGVRWAANSSRVDKLAPVARAETFPKHAIRGDGRVELDVSFFMDVTNETAGEQTQARGGEILEWLDAHVARVAIAREGLVLLASMDEVEWVQPAAGPKVSDNAVAAQRIHVTEIRSAPHNLTGAGVTVGVWDGGVVGTHTDFGMRVTVVDTSPVANHATHVAGTIGGSGAGDSSATGMATGVSIRSYDWSSDITEMRASVSDGVRLSNHSYGFVTGWSWNGSEWVDYGASGFGSYGAYASVWDEIVFDTDLIVFKSAGNDRIEGPDYPNGPQRDGPYDCISETGVGKNVITIGATTDADGMTAFSSWGPTDDGRVKPDLCANGYSLRSTLPENSYGAMTGTSMSTPSACGSAALLCGLHQQMLAADLRADTCKALLIHGAEDMGRRGPDYEYGWGLINAKSSADLLRAQSYVLGEVGNEAGQSFTANIPAGAAALKVTLVWTDPPGSPGADLALVNNLDLIVTSPDGGIIRPWKLDPSAPSAEATTGVNDVDNVEQVVVASPASGTWSIGVQGTAVPVSAPQPYALVCEYLNAGGSNHSFTISNDGGTDLTITSIALEEAASYISWSPSAPFTVPPGASQTVTVSVDFSSAPSGSSTRRLLVYSNDPDENPYPSGVYLQTTKAQGSLGYFVTSMTEGSLRRDYGDFVGMRMDVGGSPIVVAELGRMMVVGNTGTHTLKLIDAATGMDVPGGSVVIGMAGGIVGQFKYAALVSPVTLKAGASYYLVSKETFGGDYWYDVDTILTTTTAASVAGGICGSGPGAWYSYGAAGHSYVPLDFKPLSGASTHALKVTSANPGSGVAVAVAPSDKNGEGDGMTTFSRTYESGTVVTLVVPEVANGNPFLRWNKNGVAYATTPAIQVTVDGSHTMTAVYAGEGVTTFLSGASLGTTRNDYGGFVGMRVDVGTSPLAVSQLGRMMAPGNTGSHTVKFVNGATGQDVEGGSVVVDMSGGTAGQFKYVELPSSIILNASTTYYLVSQEIHGGDLWHDIDTTLDASDAASIVGGIYGSGPGAWFAYGAANHSYVPLDFAYTVDSSKSLTVMSSNPGAGVAIAVTPGDNNNLAGGTTAFTRFYAAGTVVTLTAPETANGNPFQKWKQDGQDYAVTNSITVTMDAPHTLMAVFGSEENAALITGMTLGTLRNDFSGFVGAQIEVGADPLVVSQLGRIMVEGNTGSHTVKLVSASTGNDVAGGSVVIDMSEGVPGAFKYAALAVPVVLAANTHYYLVSEESLGGDKWHDIDTSVTTGTAATLVSGIFSLGGGAWYPYGNAGHSYVPVDLVCSLEPKTSSSGFVAGAVLGTLRSDYTGYVGMRIDVGASPITVTELARMMAPGNTGTHLVALVDAVTGQEVPGGTTSISMSSGTVGQFQYQALASPVTLPAGASYYLVSYETAGGDQWHDVDTALSSKSHGSIVGGIYGSGPGAWYPYGGPGRAYVPLDFKYSTE